MKKTNKQNDSLDKGASENRVPVDSMFSMKKLTYILLGLFTSVLVIVVYSNILHSPFLFDDWASITENYHIRLTQFTLKGLIDAGFKSYASHRPIANISFALNYYFHGYNVAGYHIVNIIIHLIAGLFLFLFINDTIKINQRLESGTFISKDANPALLAFVVALVWLVHPLNTQSVTYIVQRMNSMAAMFYMMSMWCYVKGRLSVEKTKWGFFAGCVISGFLAIGTKEISGTLPFFILLYEWYFFQDLDRSR